MSLEVSIREITPEEALQILERNQNNRVIRPRKVQQYARDMKSGRWRLNGQGLLFKGDYNGSGTLYDGQHRLLGCIMAGKSFQTLVATGLTEADHATIDTGMTRTFADELSWRGEANVRELASVCLLGWTYDNEGPAKAGKTGASRGELLNWLRKNPEVRESVRVSKAVKELMIRRSAFSITHYLILREHGVDVANTFEMHLGRGTDYGDGDPCLALRAYAVNVARVSAMRPSTVEWFAICIKAANHFLAGVPVKQLRWRRLGPARENFPTLVTKEDAIDVLSDYANDLS